jgi:hypothetical protein
MVGMDPPRGQRTGAEALDASDTESEAALNTKDTKGYEEGMKRAKHEGHKGTRREYRGKGRGIHTKDTERREEGLNTKGTKAHEGNTEARGEAFRMKDTKRA